MTTIQANSSRQYLIRMGIIALAGIVFALYCVYDGAIGYPNQRVRALKYQEIQKSLDVEGNVKPLSERKAQWKEVATENGWNPNEKNLTKAKTEADCTVQFLMAGLAGSMGILFSIRVLLASRRWIAADESGLRTSGGLQIPYDQIITISKKLWRTKGIARVRYWQESRKKRLVLDDYKFDRTATEAIVRRIESKITPEQIVDGKPEPPLQDPPKENTEDSQEIAQK
jgi:hypothetical protein